MKKHFVLARKNVKSFLSHPAPYKMLFVRTPQNDWNVESALCTYPGALLSKYGESQAEGLEEHIFRSLANKFDFYHCSELYRSGHLATKILGLKYESKINEDMSLNEWDFGINKYEVYEGLSESELNKFSSFDYRFSKGESFGEVRARSLEFIEQQKLGTHLVFTHGGVIYSLLQDQGLLTIPPPGSIIGTIIDHDTMEIHCIDFTWEFPIIPATR